MTIEIYPGQSKAVWPSQTEPIILLVLASLTVMEKWSYIQPNGFLLSITLTIYLQ